MDRAKWKGEQLGQKTSIKGKKPALARDAYNLVGQPMFKVLAKVNGLEAQGRRILHFEIGEPQFPSPANVVQAAYNALNAGKTHYVNSMGIQELREVVCDDTEKELGFRPIREQILITPANAVIYFLIRCVVNSGEEVIFPDPGFPTYSAAISFTGVKPVPVPLKEDNAFRMLPDDIRKVITNRARPIIINSPQNPTGAVMTQKEIEEVASVAEEAGVYLLSDETYSKITYGAVHYSASVSDHCLETIISCVPPFIQYAGITALTEGREYSRSMVGNLWQRRDEIVRGLNSLPGVSCRPPSGAFYVFPNITRTGLSSEQFVDLMLDKAGVALLSGTNFGKYGEGYVRLSYATSSEIIEEAVEKMRQVLQ